MNIKLYKKLLACLLTCLVISFSGIEGIYGATSARDYNIILISITNLRADHLGCYGYPRGTSPNIDNLAKKSLLFSQAFAQATWSLPSYASIFTSKYVKTHKVFSMRKKLADSELTLAEILKIFGYNTVAFSSNIYLNKKFNLDQGFDVYEDTPFTLNSPLKSNIQDTYFQVLKWIDLNQENKFFLFFNIAEAHPPLHLPPDGDDDMFDSSYKGKVDSLPLVLQLRNKVYKDIFISGPKITLLSPEDKNHIIAHYDAAINYIDKYIGNLFLELERRKLIDKTIIILTADHGVDLFEHGTLFNYMRQAPYEEIIHVPLMIFYPTMKDEGRQISSHVQLIDILPTILEFLGISAKEDAQGISLVPLIKNKKANSLNRATYATGCDSRSKTIQECSNSIRESEWKFIKPPAMPNRSYFELKLINLLRIFESFMPSPELYNLKADPGESNNLFYKNKKISGYFNDELKEWMNLSGK